MRGRAIRLSVQRRMMIDLLYFARAIPTVPVQKRMSITRLIEARASCKERPRWLSLFAKGYALAADEFPQLRRAYVKLPWPQLYEYPTSRANIIIERDYLGESAVCPVSIKDPAHQSLGDIGRLIEHATTAPVEEIKDFSRWMKLARLPRFLRRPLWWVGLNWGRQRGNFFGTFGISVYSALKAESLHPLAPVTTLLNYGVISENGGVDVRVIYDHRVMDGTTVARALTRLEEILNSDIAEEVRSLAQSD
jgi:pyruvate/2-oxoglutarate dehydrogenase complex dihydrolipoamide acyltransferase (E2) component